MMNTKNRVLIWDLPTRLFHWFFAGGFIVAAIFSLAFDEHSPLFPYHAIFGLIISMMVVLRVIWGIVGTRYARFNSFIFSPRKVFEYAKGVLRGGGIRYVGHNPGSAYATLAMLLIMIGLAITGIMLGLGNEWAEEIHEFLAYTMVAVVAIHIMGVLVYTIRHRENIAASMIHGKKYAESHEAIPSSLPIIGVIFIVLTVSWSWGLFTNYDTSIQSLRLPLVGIQLQLGEIEDELGKSEEHEYEDDHYKNDRDDDHDDDDDDDDDHDDHDD